MVFASIVYPKGTYAQKAPCSKGTSMLKRHHGCTQKALCYAQKALFSAQKALIVLNYMTDINLDVSGSVSPPQANFYEFSNFVNYCPILEILVPLNFARHGEFRKNI